jgi:hypothetical protein
MPPAQLSTTAAIIAWTIVGTAIGTGSAWAFYRSPAENLEAERLQQQKFHEENLAFKELEFEENLAFKRLELEARTATEIECAWIARRAAEECMREKNRRREG